MKKGKFLLFISIIVGILFLFTVSCKNLKYSTLNGNFHFKKANSKYQEEDYKSAATEYANTIKANPDFIAAYYYLGSCYQQLFKPGLPVNKQIVQKLGEKLEKIEDLKKLKDVVYQINMINDYDKLVEYINKLNVENEPEEMKETKEEEIKEKGEEKEIKTNEKVKEEKQVIKKNKELKKDKKQVKKGEKQVKKGEKQAVEQKKELTKDEKVALIIKKWEEEKKAEEAKKKAAEEAKKKAQKALIVTEQPTQPTEAKKPEEAQPVQLNPQQKKMMIKNTVRAIKALANAILIKNIDTASIDSAISLAQLYDNLGIFEKAEKYYTELLKKYKTNKAYYVISDFYSKYGKDKKAEEYLNKAISLNPNDPDGYLYLAQYYLQKLKYDEAIKAIDKNIELLEKKPNVSAHDKAVAYYRLGVDCWIKSYKKKYLPKDERKKVLEKGFAALDKAIELDPNYPEPYSYYNLLLREKIKIDPKNKNLYLAKAKKYAEKFTQLYKKLQARKKLAKQLEEQK